MNRVIYTPDGEPITVQWYISDSKAVGVESITNTWIARPVSPKPAPGFGPPRDKK